MNLIQWEHANGMRSYPHTTCTKVRYVHDIENMPRHIKRQLWYLSDYVVSSVIAGTIWLIQKDASE